MSALARRAVACKGWRWMPGQPVVDAHGVRGYVVDIAPLPEPGAWAANRAGVAWLSAAEMGRCLPDLTDPATRGCLLALVREELGRPRLVAYYAPLSSGQGWYVADRFCGDRDYPVVKAPSGTEAEALVAALEAAGGGE